MMKNLTEVVFILDRSGSMSGKEEDTIGGFNSMLNEQKGLEGDVLISTVLFNDEIEVLHDRIPLAQVNPLTNKDYYVRGCTALLDALGGGIHHIANIHKCARSKDCPDHTLFVIITDGLENASRSYSANQVRKMVKHQQEKCGWKFIFMGANMDAIVEAEHYGFNADCIACYDCCAPLSQHKNFHASSKILRHLRRNEKIDASWKEELEEKTSLLK